MLSQMGVCRSAICYSCVFSCPCVLCTIYVKCSLILTFTKKAQGYRRCQIYMIQCIDLSWYFSTKRRGIVLDIAKTSLIRTILAYQLWIMICIEKSNRLIPTGAPGTRALRENMQIHPYIWAINSGTALIFLFITAIASPPLKNVHISFRIGLGGPCQVDTAEASLPSLVDPFFSCWAYIIFFSAWLWV